MESGVNVTFRIPMWLDKICAWPLMQYRRLRYGEPFRKIYLGEGEYTIVDPPDYYAYGKYKWVLLGTGRHVYAVREMKIGPKRTKRMYLHREIMKPPKGKVVDHRENGGLDNRRANLRIATHAENMQNRGKMRKKTTSRFIGVHLDKEYYSWIVQISYDGKILYLGSFKNEVEAAKAYDEAAKKYHGEFARLNFPEAYQKANIKK